MGDLMGDAAPVLGEPPSGVMSRARHAAVEHPAAIVLGAAIVVWVWVFGRLVVQRHDRFGSFGFDMGIYDQGVWLIGHGHHFVTVRGLDLFGHHVNVPLFLFVPFYWMGAGPDFLNVAQVVMLALGAVPVFLLGRSLLGGEWPALIPALAYLAHPSVQFLTWELFHPDVWAIAPMIGAWVAARHRRWGWYWVLVFYSMAWKEDVGLAVAMMGLLIALMIDRRRGLQTILVGVAWFLIATRLVIPAFTPDGPFYDTFYGDLGESTLAVAVNSARHPDLALDHLDHTDAPGYVRDLAAPYGFTSFASPTVLIGLPQVAANTLSVQTFTADTRFHYVAMPLVGLTIGMVEGIAVISRARWWRRHRSAVQAVLLGIVALASWHTTTSWGLSPVGELYDGGYWPHASARDELLQDATTIPPGDASIAATYNLVPHLTHREQIYEFPNPWIPTNWGTDRGDTPDPGVVDWLVVDEHLMIDAPRRELFDRLTAPGGEFVVRWSQDGVVVAERVRPPDPNAGTEAGAGTGTDTGDTTPGSAETTPPPPK